MANTLKLGLPKGSLQKSTIDLFEKAGYKILVRDRSYIPVIDDPEIECLMFRAQEMARFVERGVLDVGLTGKDWILENEADVVEVEDLIYSKNTTRAYRWVLALPEGSNIRSVADLHGKRIATEVYALTADSGAAPTHSAAVDVPGIAEASMDPNFLTAELKGDARIFAKKGRVDKMTVSATYGKISLDVLEVVVGGTIQDTGVTNYRWRLLGDNSLPYFKAEFKIEDVDTGLGDLHVRLYKCQLTGGTLITGQTDEFGQPTLELEAISLESNDYLVDVELYDAVTALSA